LVPGFALGSATPAGTVPLEKEAVVKLYSLRVGIFGKAASLLQKDFL